MQISSSLLLYSGWKAEPIKQLLDPFADILGLLDKFLETDIPQRKLPQLTLHFPIYIKPSTSRVPASLKPNHILLIASLFSTQATERKILLSSFDILMPRKVLVEILSSKFTSTPFSCIAYRMYKDGPIAIDRVSSYTTNPKSIGMQFESKSVASGPHFRTYGIFCIELCGMKICVTGEVDAVDEKGLPVEIKTKPINASNECRDFICLLQNRLGNVKTCVNASFIRCGKSQVLFAKENCQIDDPSLREFTQQQNDSILSGVSVLNSIISSSKVGVAQKATGRGKTIQFHEAREYNCGINENVVDLLVERF